MNKEQKNKEQQIEEMAKDYYGYSIDLEDDCKFVAEEMYNKGHRKIPEDSIVLSREESQALKKQIEYWEYETKVAREEIDNAGKETAREILQCLYDKCYETQNSRGGFAHITPLDILTLAKHYGVEVEE